MEKSWRLSYCPLETFPKLAWIAEVDPASRTVRLCHGASVEARSLWCVEGVWEDDFDRGNFHLVENFFGSGVRVDGNDLVFSASIAPVDRLVHVMWRGRWYVSNSLVQLLARTGARLSLQHDYVEETFASRFGIHKYPGAIRVDHADFAAVYQDYHCNLTFTQDRWERSVRSFPRRFPSFESYEQALLRTLRAIGDNYRSRMRRHEIAAFATTSAGYDSSAVSALGKSIGITETFTTEEETRVAERHRESGLPVARALGLKPLPLRATPTGISAVERYFLAASIDGSEVVYHDLIRHIEAHCRSAVVLTGYYGDVIWGRGKPAFTDDIRRKDVSGLGITEVRLWAGFVHVPVPTLFARNITDIAAISASTEMQAWSVAGDYDRPIPRRIAETAGVPRHAFGRAKRAQVSYYNEPKNALLRKEFFDYVTRGLGISRARLEFVNLLRDTDQRIAKLRERRPLFADRLQNRRSLMFVWAANSLAAEFASVYSEQASASDG
jgi:hypothetical protein